MTEVSETTGRKSRTQRVELMAEYEAGHLLQHEQEIWKECARLIGNAVVY